MARVNYVPDWFLLEAAGRKQPLHPGLTMAEWRLTQTRNRRLTILTIGLLVVIAWWL